MKITIPNQQGVETELDIFPLEYLGQRVLTTKQLSPVLGCSRQNISVNFNRHINEFIEGVDYFILNGLELRRFIQHYAGMSVKPRFRDKSACDFWSAVSPQAHDLYLWTFTEAFKNSQYLGTSNAAIICFSALFVYFNAKTPASEPEPQLPPPAQPEPSAQPAPDDKRIEMLMKLIDKCKNDDLRDKLILATASLILGRQI